MYRRLLVPLDGSELSETVLPYAIETAGRLDLDTTLIHVRKLEKGESSPLHQSYVQYRATVVKRKIEQIRQRFSLDPESKSLDVRGELVFGYPAEEIVRYAEENGVDLILMATHGRSGIRRWVMGSVADKVLQSSTVPVWLINTETAEGVAYEKWPKRTMVVPLDGSQLAEKVIPHVEAMTKQRGDEPMEVVLLHVSEPAVTLTYYSPSARMETPDGVKHIMPEDYERQLLAQQKRIAAEYLDNVATRLKKVFPQVQTRILEGDPANAIIDYVENLPFSIVIMSTHARSGLGRWAYGSVAAKLLQKVPRPILLVRPKSQ
jgi:nucleotide-binding universal stress UspA family protein